MKKVSLLLLFLGTVLLGQNYEFTGTGSNAAWNNPSNWVGGVVPLMNSYTKGTITIPEGKTAVISADDVLHWAEGTLKGPGSIINNGEFNIEFADRHDMNTNLKFHNHGILNIGHANTTSSNRLYLSWAETEIINEAAGLVNLFRKDIQLASSNPGSFTNNGTINKSSNFPVVLDLPFNNNKTINVEENELILKSTTRINGGTYNVSEDAALTFGGTNYFEGTLDGNIQGEFNLGETYASTFIVEEGKTLINQLSGKGITQGFGDFRGPGNLINETTYTVGFKDRIDWHYNFKFNNKGILNIGDINTTSEKNMYLSWTETELLNDASGVVNLFRKDIHLASSNPGSFTNNGTINKSGNFPAALDLPFYNNKTINVEENELTLKRTTRVNGGTYNVSEGAALTFTDINYFEGTLVGNIQGEFNLGISTSNNFYVEADKTFVNQLSGNGITQGAGDFRGPGTLINETIYTVSFTDRIDWTTDFKFNNKGILNIGDINTTSDKNLYLSWTGTELINDASGVVNLFRKDIHFSSSNPGSITNKGLINKESNFSSEILTELTNENGGRISVKDGRLYMSGVTHNKEGGLMEGVHLEFKGANYLTNNGTVNPGIGVGQMTIETFFGMDNGILEFELQGLTPVSEYDYIEYTGTKNIDLNGSIKVLLSFEPQLNDSFTVFRANNANITAQLGEFAYGYYEGYEYKFSVLTTNDEIILTMISKTLDIEDENKIQLQIYPNPVTTVLNLNNDKSIDRIEVFNTQGQSMMKKEINEKQGQLDFSRLPAGIYMLKIHIGNKVIMKKTIKK